MDQLWHRSGATTMTSEPAVAEWQLESEPAEFPTTNRQSRGNSETEEVVQQQPEEVWRPGDASRHLPLLTEGVREPVMASNEPPSTIVQPYLHGSQRVHKVQQNLRLCISITRLPLRFCLKGEGVVFACSAMLACLYFYVGSSDSML